MMFKNYFWKNGSTFPEMNGKNKGLNARNNNHTFIYWCNVIQYLLQQCTMYFKKVT